MISAAKPPAAAPPVPQPTAADDFEVEELEEAVLDLELSTLAPPPNAQGYASPPRPRGHR